MALRYTVKELLLFPPAEPSNWIVEGLLRTNRPRPSLLCGIPGSGKSTLARQLAVAVATGEPFLDRETTQGGVIYWQTEDSREDIVEDLRRIGLTDDVAANLSFISPDSGDNNFDDLVNSLAECPATKLVIVETLADFLNVDDINNNDDCRKALKRFSDLVIKPNPNCAFLILHHMNKSDMKSKGPGSRILGGTTIAGGADAKIFLEQGLDADRRRVIRADIRKGRPIEETYLNFDEDRLIATLGKTLRHESIANRDAKNQQQQDQLDARIGDAVRAEPGKPKWLLVDKIGGNKKMVGARIDKHIEVGLITTAKGGEKGNAILLYDAETGMSGPNARLEAIN